MRVSRRASAPGSVHWLDKRFSYSADELGELSFDNGLNDSSIDISEPYSKECADDKKPGKDKKIESFFCLPRWNRDNEELFDSCQENFIYVSFTALIILY
jgi:hypothetical protein